jgi:hypothetical protein
MGRSLHRPVNSDIGEPLLANKKPSGLLQYSFRSWFDTSP